MAKSAVPDDSLAGFPDHGPEHGKAELSDQKAELDKAVAAAHDARQSTLNSMNDAALAREALHLSEERFRMLADNMSPLAWICDQLGNVTWYNKRWLEYTGMTFEEMAGWDWSKVQHPDYVERVVAGVKRSRDTGEVWEDTFPLRGKDGAYRWFLSRAIPIRDTAGEVVQWFGTNTDVTDNRLAEAALIKSEKLAAAGRLAFVLAHEINNPLQAVTNLMALLETSEELHASTRKHARMAAEELARISHLTRQSLKFYRESTSPGPVDVQEALDGVLDFYARQCENRGITVSRQYRSNVTIQSYAGEIRQIITTLLVNAMEAIPAAGAIVVHVRQAGHRSRRGMAGVRIAIADSGTGISKENLSRLFEPFFTTKGQQGTGLGLWVAQGIVSRLGGSMKVRSCDCPQKSGTVFSIFFPSRLPNHK
ncbi:MAG TPA: ATP-binding protein [Terracidiphilus sp.]|nr:ATP-binding protein [Terracidiphilus sp.]